MRLSLLLLIVILPACGDNREGLLVTVHAPDGPTTASRIEIVLASAAQGAIDDVQGQRAAPTDLTLEDARYYRQRATAGAIPIDKLDGFEFRLEADVATIPESSLVPFVIALDDRDAIVGIGGVLDDDGMPTEVSIEPGGLLHADVAMTALGETTLDGPIDAGKLARVACGFPSGLAWQAGTGPQLRLLLPDTSNDATATDASSRTLDMDCDGAEADDDDCDDLRSEFHQGADEICDGRDVDCDFKRAEVVSCDPAAATCGPGSGFQVCSDVPNNMGPSTACIAEPECACMLGACNECALAVVAETDPKVKTCEPYQTIPPLTIPGCGTECDVEVVDPPGNPWRVQLSTTGGNLQSKLTGVTGAITVHVELEDGDALALPASHRVGGIYLHVIPTNAGQPTGTASLQTWNIKLFIAAQCDASPTPFSCTTISG